MTGVRVLVGTRKGAFVLTSDGARRDWEISGPHFPGWEIYHVKGSPADPDRIYASQSGGWFGQLIQRSDDGGRTWNPVGNEFAYEGDAGTHQFFDGTPVPWKFTRVWHLEPSLDDPDTVYAGVEDAALFRSVDGGAQLAGARRPARPRHRAVVAARSGRDVPAHDPARPARRRADHRRDLGGGLVPDATTAARPGGRSTAGCRSEGIPDPDAEVGHCVHHLAMHPSRPDTLFMQKHWDVMRSDDGGENWREISGNLPTDFGFVVDVHAHEPETVYVVPITSDYLHVPIDGQAARLPQPDRRRRVGAADPRPASGALLRQRAARRDGGRHPRRVRHLLRHHRRAGLRLAGRRRQLGPDRPRPAGGAVGGGADAADDSTMTTRSGSCCPPTCASSAGSTGEVVLGVDSPVTQRSVLDALEARHPVLRGTIREHGTLRRRAFVRFFACERDLSHEPPDDPAARRGRGRGGAAAGRGRDGGGLSRGPRTARGPPFGRCVRFLSVVAPSIRTLSRARSAEREKERRDDRGRSRTARGGAELERQLEQHRRELTGYCYRMLGSAFEAEDAVQETMVRAWRSHDRFEGRSSLRSWLYRIATNVCLDMLDGRNRRARPMEMGPEGTGEGPLGDVLPESVWLQPMPDGRVLAPETDPAELAVQRESIRLAFMAALQHLPPRQRVVLILREVLRWKADEVAALLGSSVASVNSALQRARATMDATGLTPGDVVEPEDEGQRELLGRYLDAFERYDLDSLTSLLTEDATLSMPPYPLWMRGPDNIRQWMLGRRLRLPGIAAGADGGERLAGVRALPPDAGRRAPGVGRCR